MKMRNREAIRMGWRSWGRVWVLAHTQRESDAVNQYLESRLTYLINLSSAHVKSRSIECIEEHTKEVAYALEEYVVSIKDLFGKEDLEALNKSFTELALHLHANLRAKTHRAILKADA
jgi:hypothetical protein